jgi:hypothetical protein
LVEPQWTAWQSFVHRDETLSALKTMQSLEAS